MSKGKVGDDWGKMYGHVTPPADAPPGTAPRNHHAHGNTPGGTKDPQYTNPMPAQNFPRGVKGTDETGRSFGKYDDLPPGFSGSGPAGLTWADLLKLRFLSFAPT